MEVDVAEMLDCSEFISCKPIVFKLSTKKFKWLPELEHGVAKGDGVVDAAHEEVDKDDAVDTVDTIGVSASSDL